MLGMNKRHEKKNLVKAKNAIYMIQKNLYWNYYYLNISNTNLNVIFRNMPALKKRINKYRRYSHKKLGLAKMAVMDLKRSIRVDVKKLQDEKESLFKQITAIKHKKFKKGVVHLIRHKVD